MVKKTIPCKRNNTLDVLGNTENVEPKKVSGGEMKVVDKKKVSPKKIHKVVSKKMSVKSISPKISPKLHRNSTPNLQKENSSIKKRNGRVKNLINAFEKTIEMSGADPKIMAENLKIQGKGPPQDAFQLLMGKRGDTPLKTSQNKVKRRKKNRKWYSSEKIEWLAEERKIMNFGCNFQF